MSLPEADILHRNLAALRPLSDEQLIMVALGEIVSALAMSNTPGIPPAKAITLHSELNRRAGVKF